MSVCESQATRGTVSEWRRTATALAAKEWREQRWRFFLGTLVLTTLLAGLLRAEVIPRSEAALLIYWPVGVVLVIFLAMGPVATERSDRTWEFLLAQPVPKMEVLRIKWFVGLLQLIGMMTIATIGGVLAMWSRGFRMMPPGFDRQWQTDRQDLVGRLTEGTFGWLSAHPIVQLCVVGAGSTVALACWYTPLFLILTRARNEFTAALGGILLTIAAHAWLAQFFAVSARLSERQSWLIVPAVFNPLAGLVLSLMPGWAVFLPVVVIVHIFLWIVLPLWLMQRRLGRGGTP